MKTQILVSEKLKALTTKLVASMTTAVAALTLAAPAAALASDTIRLGVPAYGGDGCPAGTASVALSDDGSALSILFDQYQVEAGYAVGKAVARKSCNLAIPVHVPHGLSVSVISVDYRGFNSLPYGAYSTLTSEYFFAGARGPRFQKVFAGAVEDDYLVNNTMTAIGQVWSPCGMDTNMRVNAALMVRSNARGDQALSTVDSADIQAGLLYRLAWRTCGGGI